MDPTIKDNPTSSGFLQSKSISHPTGQLSISVVLNKAGP